ncbi:hypothetical protein CEXT_454401, partial [Caerostris extrusa]
MASNERVWDVHDVEVSICTGYRGIVYLPDLSNPISQQQGVVA